LLLAGIWLLHSTLFTRLAVSPMFHHIASSNCISGRGHPPPVVMLLRYRSMTADFISFHLFFIWPTLRPFPPTALPLTESAMCCHNISFLFSVTPLWKCEVNNSISFSNSSNNVKFSESLHFVFTLSDEISPCTDIVFFPVKADDNCPEGRGFVR